MYNLPSGNLEDDLGNNTNSHSLGMLNTLQKWLLWLYRNFNPNLQKLRWDLTIHQSRKTCVNQIFSQGTHSSSQILALEGMRIKEHSPWAARHQSRHVVPLPSHILASCICKFVDPSTTIITTA